MFTIIFAALALAVIALGTLVILSLFGVGWESGRPVASGAVDRRFLPWLRPRESTVAVGTWAQSLARRTAARFLRQGRTAKVTHNMTDELLGGVSVAVGQAGTNARRDCEENCHSRRHEQIGVTAPELFRLAEEILETRPAGEVDRIRRAAEANAAEAKGQDAAAYREAKVTCPLLGRDEVCMAWGARPIHCRSWRLKGSCDGAEGGRTKGTSQPRLDATAMSIGGGVSQGLCTALGDAGLDGQLYELNSALARALSTPDAEERWLNGEPVLADCQHCASRN